VTVAAIVSTALGLLVLVAYLLDTEVAGERGTVQGLVILEALLLGMGYGLWRARYWAVLGFQALLVFQLIIAALSLMRASNWWAVLLTGSILIFGGWLFWKLIRSMARLQMPERPG
jgi:hypothetical protein